MQLNIKGEAYYVDAKEIVRLVSDDIRPYLDSNNPKGSKWVPLVLGAKALIRPFLGTILRENAKILGVEDWETLKPQRHEDLALKLLDNFSDVFARLLDATIAEVDTNGDTVAGLPSGKPLPQLSITRAQIGDHTLYEAATSSGTDAGYNHVNG